VGELCIDMTDQKCVEVALRKSERTFPLIGHQHMAPMFVWTKGSSGRLQNPAPHKLTTAADPSRQ